MDLGERSVRDERLRVKGNCSQDIICMREFFLKEYLLNFLSYYGLGGPKWLLTHYRSYVPGSFSLHRA